MCVCVHDSQLERLSASEHTRVKAMQAAALKLLSQLRVVVAVSDSTANRLSNRYPHLSTALFRVVVPDLPTAAEVRACTHTHTHTHTHAHTNHQCGTACDKERDITRPYTVHLQRALAYLPHRCTDKSTACYVHATPYRAWAGWCYLCIRTRTHASAP